MGSRAVQTTFFETRSHSRIAPEAFQPPPSEPEVEPEIIDPDPDGLRTDGTRLMASVLTLHPVSALKAAQKITVPGPDGPEVEPEIIDPDPDGLTASSAGETLPALRQVLFFEPTCRRTSTDDHGDTLSCSTPLVSGRSVVGELTNEWGDDSDVFSFQLTEASQVEFVLVAESVGVTQLLLDSKASHSPQIFCLRTTPPERI